MLTIGCNLATVAVVVGDGKFAPRRFNTHVTGAAALNLGDVVLCDGAAVHGVITDDTHEPAPGVLVLLSRVRPSRSEHVAEDPSISAVSGNDGRIVFRQRISPGEWSISMNSLVYERDMDSHLEIRSGQSEQVAFTVRRRTPDARIVGQVIDSNNTPLAALSVVAYDTTTQKTLGKATTDGAGYFRFTARVKDSCEVVIDAASKYRSPLPGVFTRLSESLVIVRAEQLPEIDVRIMCAGVPYAGAVDLRCSRLRLAKSYGDFSVVHVDKGAGEGHYIVYCRDDSPHSIVCVPSSADVEVTGSHVVTIADKRVVITLCPRIHRAAQIAMSEQISNLTFQLVRVIDRSMTRPPPRILDPRHTVFTEFTSAAGGLVTDSFETGSALAKAGLMVVPDGEYVLVLKDPEDGTTLGWLPVETRGASVIHIREDQVSWLASARGQRK